jgi:hypothetical protein
MWLLVSLFIFRQIGQIKTFSVGWHITLRNIKAEYIVKGGMSHLEVTGKAESGIKIEGGENALYEYPYMVSR